MARQTSHSDKSPLPPFRASKQTAHNPITAMNKTAFLTSLEFFAVAFTACHKRTAHEDRVSTEPSRVPASATTRLASDDLSPLIEVSGGVYQRLNMGDLARYHGDPIFVIVLRVKNTGESAIAYDSIESGFFPQHGVGRSEKIQYLDKGGGVRLKTLEPGKVELLEFTGSTLVRHELLMAKDEPLHFSLKFRRNGTAVTDRFVAELPDAKDLPLQSDVPNQSNQLPKGNRAVEHPLTFKRVVGK